MMLSFFKKHKKEILISLGTGIALFYVEPVLNFLSNKVVSVAILVSKEYSNNFYTALAKKDLGEFDEYNSTLLSYLFILAIVISYAGFRKIIDDFNSKIERHKAKNYEINERVKKSKLKLQDSNEIIETKTREEKKIEIEIELAGIEEILLYDDNFFLKTNISFQNQRRIAPTIRHIPEEIKALFECDRFADRY